jgi:hypothetical protein
LNSAETTQLGPAHLLTRLAEEVKFEREPYMIFQAPPNFFSILIPISQALPFQT